MRANREFKAYKIDAIQRVSIDVPAMLPSSGYKTIPLKCSLNKLKCLNIISPRVRETHVAAHTSARASEKRASHVKLKS